MQIRSFRDRENPLGQRTTSKVRVFVWDPIRAEIGPAPYPRINRPARDRTDQCCRSVRKYLPGRRMFK